jgi:hypothetical protein
MHDLQACSIVSQPTMLSVVGIATGYELGERAVGARVPVGSRIFCSPRRPDRLWRKPYLYPKGTWDSFLWDKAGVLGADHLPPAKTYVKKIWIYTCTPPYASMAQCLIN